MPYEPVDFAVTARPTEITAAYITRNTVAMADLGVVIETIGRALRVLGREDSKPASAKPAPAVPVRRSIQQDHLVCLVCGNRLQVLRRHLSVVHQLTPEPGGRLCRSRSTSRRSPRSFTTRRVRSRGWRGRRTAGGGYSRPARPLLFALHDPLEPPDHISLVLLPGSAIDTLAELGSQLLPVWLRRDAIVIFISPDDPPALDKIVA
jgi:ROS/MUCR transcriptional regulator protein